MLVRIVAALVLVPLLVVLLIGGIPLYIGEAILIAIALKEFYKAFNQKKIYPIRILGYIFAIYLPIKNYFDFNMNFTISILLILFLIGILFMLNQKQNIIELAITFIGIFYVAIFMDSIVLTYKLNMGHIYVWLIFIIAFATDTFAYFAGVFFGKHKLIPKVSPKKTIEGSIGGILGSTIICAIFGYVFNLDMTYMVLIGSVGSIIAQIGDLFASSIKRHVEIKDYGKLIPGHGGILDRFDSVILVAPFVYYILLIFQ